MLVSILRAHALAAACELKLYFEMGSFYGELALVQADFI
tara:strand:+ start:324 stop:440 length:117 start_codon:yes stop_codon:yes gene_type:complete